MGLLDTIKSALGLTRPPRPFDPRAPLELGAGARERLAALGPGEGIHISTRATPGGHLVVVDEGPLQGPPPHELAPHPITVGDADLVHLRGLVLTYRDGWAIDFRYELYASETPNPNSRLYTCNRPLAERGMYVSSPEGAPWLAGRLLDHPSVVGVFLRDHTVTVERTPGSPWPGIDAHVDAALREHFSLCGKALGAGDAPELADALEEEVAQVIEERVLPGVHRDGGDIHLVGVTDGVARVRMSGACRGCPSSTVTLKMGVERVLKEAFPGVIHAVEQV